MIDYGRHLMQDALETKWSTTRYAHLVVLQDVECSKLSRRNPDHVEKVRIRNMARVILPKNINQSSKPGKPNTKDKVCADKNQNNCSHQSGGRLNLQTRLPVLFHTSKLDL